VDGLSGTEIKRRPSTVVTDRAVGFGDSALRPANGCMCWHHSSVPRNVEIKAWLHSRNDIEQRAAALADAAPQVIRQDDTFFGGTNERLKLRRLAPDLGELIWYARPDADGPRTSDYEITRTRDPDGLARVLGRAYPVIGRVVKQRTLYLVGRSRIHLDEVERLGDLMELEIVLNEGEPEAHGIREADELMRALGIASADLVDRAYVDLLADRTTET
jgi:adenylate cyclase